MRLTKEQYERIKIEIKELAKRYYREKGEMPAVEEVVQLFGVSFTFAYNAIRMAQWELTHPTAAGEGVGVGGGGVNSGSGEGGGER